MSWLFEYVYKHTFRIFLHILVSMYVLYTPLYVISESYNRGNVITVYAVNWCMILHMCADYVSHIDILPQRLLLVVT